MNDKKEIILLDARIVGVIDKRAFYAVLRNDHRCVAFIEKGKWFEKKQPFNIMAPSRK